jgi:hypothetical protein
MLKEAILKGVERAAEPQAVVSRDSDELDKQSRTSDSNVKVGVLWNQETERVCCVLLPSAVSTNNLSVSRLQYNVYPKAQAVVSSVGTRFIPIKITVQPWL